MKTNKRIKTLQNSPKTVFSSRELRNLWEMDKDWFKTTVKRMVDNGVLERLSRGYYLFGSDLNPFELANLITTPSYVSFNSALRYFDINFQSSNTIFSTASISYERNIAGYIFKYHKIKDEILFNDKGIKTDSGVTLALPERAILDSFYHNFPLNIDRSEKINKKYLIELSKMYPKFVQDKAKNF